MDLKKIRERAEVVLKNIDFLESERVEKELLLSTLKDELEKENKIFFLKEKAILSFQNIIKVISLEKLQDLNKEINNALKYVFFDLNLEVRISVVEERGLNRIEYIYVFNNDMGVREVGIFDDGAGIRSVVGLITQIFFINLIGSERVLIYDESFTALSDKYIKNFEELLRILVKDFGFSFLFITHDPRIQEIADVVYVMRKGEIKKLEGKGEEIDSGGY